MIIDYDHNPKASYEQKLQSLKESVQLALNEVGSGAIQPKYPIGSVYESVHNVNPSNYFGGTWTLIGDAPVTDSASIYAVTYKWVRTA